MIIDNFVKRTRYIINSQPGATTVNIKMKNLTKITSNNTYITLNTLQTLYPITNKFDDGYNAALRGNVVVENIAENKNAEIFYNSISNLLKSNNKKISFSESYSSKYLNEESLWIKANSNLFAKEMRLINKPSFAVENYDVIKTKKKYTSTSVPEKMILVKNPNAALLKNKSKDDLWKNEILSSGEISEINMKIQRETPYMRLLRYKDFPTISSYRDFLINKKKYSRFLTSYTEQKIEVEKFENKSSGDIHIRRNKNMDLKDTFKNLLINYYFNDIYEKHDDEMQSFYLRSFNEFYKNKISTKGVDLNISYTDITSEKTVYLEFPENADADFNDWADGIYDLLVKNYWKVL